MGIDVLNLRRIALKRSDLFCLLLVLPWINRTTLLVKHALAGDSVVYLSENVFFSYVPFDPKV
jgi:hypothetical protein